MKPAFRERLEERAILLRKEVYALFLACRDPRVFWHTKALAGLVVAYALCPIDLIPDPIPVLGYLDDLILVPLGIMLVIKLIPPEVLQDCREKAGEALDMGKVKTWIPAAVIIAVWTSLLAISIFLLIRLFGNNG